MSVKIWYKKCASLGLRADLETADMDYNTKIAGITAEAVRLDQTILNEQEPDNGTFSLLNMLNSLIWLMDDIARKNPEDHKASPWAALRCRLDWKHHIQDIWAAPEGAEPRIGQRGVFMITLEERYQVQVSYRPDYFSGTDHLEFRHVRDGLHIDEPMPISKTGYTSFFKHRNAFTEFGSVKATALAYCAANSNVDMEAENQMSLF